MKIAIFCSANEHIDPCFFMATEQLGRWCAEQGHTILFGGTNQGLMECVAKAAHEARGCVIGIVPRIVEKDGKTSRNMDVEYPCENLSDRKDLLNTQCDVAIALPGGVGTLDEVFTLAASGCIGYHDKRVILYNIKGFWNPLLALLDHLQQTGMIRGDYRQHIAVAQSLEEIAGLLPQDADPSTASCH